MKNETTPARRSTDGTMIAEGPFTFAPDDLLEEYSRSILEGVTE